MNFTQMINDVNKIITRGNDYYRNAKYGRRIDDYTTASGYAQAATAARERLALMVRDQVAFDVDRKLVQAVEKHVKQHVKQHVKRHVDALLPALQTAIDTATDAKVAERVGQAIGNIVDRQNGLEERCTQVEDDVRQTMLDGRSSRLAGLGSRMASPGNRLACLETRYFPSVAFPPTPTLNAALDTIGPRLLEWGRKALGLESADRIVMHPVTEMTYRLAIGAPLSYSDGTPVKVTYNGVPVVANLGVPTTEVYFMRKTEPFGERVVARIHNLGAAFGAAFGAA